MLVTYRPEYQHKWASKGHYTQLLIDALPPESAGALVRAVMAEQPGVEEFARMLVERTGGNPLFLEESIKTLVETKVLVGEQRAYRLVKPLNAIEVPATVQAVLAARIDRHAPEEKRLLQSAAVIGKQAPLSLLQAVAESSEQVLRRSIARLQAGEFLYETTLFPEPQYTFKHNLTYEVAYASLLHERRRGLHARIVEVVEALPEQSRAERAEFLAYHAFQGHLWQKAVRYLRQAGQKALTRAANREAVAHFQKALEALPRVPEGRATLEQAIDLRFDLVVPNLQLGQLPQIVSLLREAESLAEKLADEQRLARAFSHLVNYFYLTGEPSKAIQYGERCQAIGHALGDSGLQELARRYMGHSYHAQGQYRQAETVLRENLDVLGATSASWLEPDRLSDVSSSAWVAWAMADVGDFPTALEFAEKALTTAEDSRHAYTKAIASTLAGLVWLRRGFPGRAVPPLQRSVQGCKEAHLPLWQPVASSLLGLALVMLDALDEALPLLEEAVSRTGELGVKAYLALWKTHLAEGLLAAGQKARAKVHAEEALDLAIAHQERGHQACALRICGEVAAQDGTGLEAAEAYFAEALTLARQLGARPLCALTHLSMGRCYRRAGMNDKAEEQLTEALSLCVDMGLGLWVDRAAAELKQLGAHLDRLLEKRGVLSAAAAQSRRERHGGGHPRPAPGAARRGPAAAGAVGRSGAPAPARALQRTAHPRLRCRTAGIGTVSGGLSHAPPGCPGGCSGPSAAGRNCEHNVTWCRPCQLHVPLGWVPALYCALASEHVQTFTRWRRGEGTTKTSSDSGVGRPHGMQAAGALHGRGAGGECGCVGGAAGAARASLRHRGLQGRRQHASQARRDRAGARTLPRQGP